MSRRRWRRRRRKRLLLVSNPFPVYFLIPAWRCDIVFLLEMLWKKQKMYRTQQSCVLTVIWRIVDRKWLQVRKLRGLPSDRVNNLNDWWLRAWWYSWRSWCPACRHRQSDRLLHHHQTDQPISAVRPDYAVLTGWYFNTSKLLNIKNVCQLSSQLRISEYLNESDNCNSRSSKCVVQHEMSKPCYCDRTCRHFRDCCPDYSQFCRGGSRDPSQGRIASRTTTDYIST